MNATLSYDENKSVSAFLKELRIANVIPTISWTRSNIGAGRQYNQNLRALHRRLVIQCKDKSVRYTCRILHELISGFDWLQAAAEEIFIQDENLMLLGYRKEETNEQALNRYFGHISGLQFDKASRSLWLSKWDLQENWPEGGAATRLNKWAECVLRNRALAGIWDPEVLTVITALFRSTGFEGCLRTQLSAIHRMYRVEQLKDIDDHAKSESFADAVISRLAEVMEIQSGCIKEEWEDYQEHPDSHSSKDLHEFKRMSGVDSDTPKPVPQNPKPASQSPTQGPSQNRMRKLRGSFNNINGAGSLMAIRPPPQNHDESFYLPEAEAQKMANDKCRFHAQAMVERSAGTDNPIDISTALSRTHTNAECISSNNKALRCSMIPNGFDRIRAAWALDPGDERRHQLGELRKEIEAIRRAQITATGSFNYAAGDASTDYCLSMGFDDIPPTEQDFIATVELSEVLAPQES